MRTLPSPDAGAARVAGRAAVVLGTATALLLGAAAALLPLLQESQLRVLRDLAFVAGVLQVAALAAFAATASFRAPVGRGVRVLGVVVAVLTLAGLPALAVPAGTALVLADRVAFLAWALVAGVSVHVRTRPR